MENKKGTPWRNGYASKTSTTNHNALFTTSMVPIGIEPTFTGDRFSRSRPGVRDSCTDSFNVGWQALGSPSPVQLGKQPCNAPTLATRREESLYMSPHICAKWLIPGMSRSVELIYASHWWSPTNSDEVYAVFGPIVMLLSVDHYPEFCTASLCHVCITLILELSSTSNTFLTSTLDFSTKKAMLLAVSIGGFVQDGDLVYLSTNVMLLALKCLLSWFHWSLSPAIAPPSRREPGCTLHRCEGTLVVAGTFFTTLCIPTF